MTDLRIEPRTLGISPVKYPTAPRCHFLAYKLKATYTMFHPYQIGKQWHKSCHTSSQSGQGVEEQFELYKNGPISPHGMDIIGFWAVSTMSHYFAICITDLFADKRRNPSNIICNGIRLSAHSSILGSI